MFGTVAVWHELWTEQQHDHYHVAQRQHDDATHGYYAVRLADDHHDDPATPPSPASHGDKQHDDHTSHAYVHYDAPFVVAQQRIDDDTAAPAIVGRFGEPGLKPIFLRVRFTGLKAGAPTVTRRRLPRER